jgi:uncharacterized membrane protein YgcG
MVIFVCGVIAGAMVIKTQGLRRAPPASSGPFFGVPGTREAISFIHRMKQADIDLTTDQSNNVVRIIQDSQATNAEIRRKYAPQLRAEAERAHQAISQVLTADQRPKFEEVEKELAQNRSGRGGEGGGRRGGEGGGRRGGEGGGRSRNSNRGGTNDVAEGVRGGSTNGAPGSNVPSTNAP